MLYPRHRLDIRVRDLIFGLTACVWALGRGRLAAGVVRALSPGEDVLVCFSVRSGLDLLLEALGEELGGEVIVSAVTHPDIVRIIEGHGLSAVPLDIAPSTLEPRIELLEAALSPRTRAVLVAQLFGGRFDLSPIAAFARRHGLLLIEDCAQAFRGPEDAGDSLADVSMFSFGSIKTTTAVGGAVLRVRNPDLLAAMRKLQEGWPVQSRRRYAGRLIRTLSLVLVGNPLVYGLLAWGCEVAGRDLDAVVNGAIRAFPHEGSEELLRRIRHRPSAPLLAVLSRRLRTFDAARLARRAECGERVARCLPGTVLHPGSDARARTHWLFPVVVPHPESLVCALRERGFDASRATSSIAPVPAPPGLSRFTPEDADRIMSRVVFLPVYPELPDEALDLLAEIVAETVAGSRTIASRA